MDDFYGVGHPLPRMWTLSFFKSLTSKISFSEVVKLVDELILLMMDYGHGGMNTSMFAKTFVPFVRWKDEKTD